MEARELVCALVDRGLTQEQISVRTGIPQPTVSKIYRGAVSDVLSRSYRKLQALHESIVAEGATKADVQAAKS